MLHVESVASLRDVCRDARASGRRVGLVPTMGFLHVGHRSLMRAARRETDFVVVTIFVNPLQFGADEDLDAYPRDLKGDLGACEAERVDCVFTPTVADMYPRPTRTSVHVDALTADLCGAARPTHFDGVTTVVTKLISIVGECDAYFGRKDAQQLAIVKRMVDDLNLPVRVHGCPLVREADGLARSSRNAYLSSAERAAAPVLFRALVSAADAARDGERDPLKLREIVASIVSSEPIVSLEYVEIRDAAELEPVSVLDGDLLVALAARIGTTRLIDNIGCTIHGEDVVVDLGEVIA